jgi:cell wall-associated NlpC family hydrolase
MDKTAPILISLALAALLAGCTPSVRYTRAQPQQLQAGGGGGGRHQEQAQSSQSNMVQEDSRPKKPAPGQNALEQIANSYLGVPYRYGGMSRSGLDCSGFVTLVFREVYDKALPRSSSKMWKAGVPVSLSAARPGDLVFFRGGSFGTIDHVGIYMGKNRFIHASISSGVTYSNLSDSYYSRRFAGIRRVL